MASVRDYLRLFRAQTAAVEGAGFPIAAWLGGAPLWTLPLFALLGILTHFGGFGENGISDLRFDRSDPSKADHPLVVGRLAVRWAAASVYGCQAAGLVLFVALTYHSGFSYVPIAAFVGYIVLGHAYNFLGKRWKPGAVLEIGGAFALAFLACGTVWTGHAAPAVWAVTAYAGLFTAFQIAVAGELKELAQPNEKNLLRRLGSRVEPLLGERFAGLIEDAVRGGAAVVVSKRAALERFLFTGGGTWALAIGLSAAKAAALGAVGWLVLGPGWGLPVGLVGWLVFFTYTLLLLRPGPFDRPRRLRIMGIGEASSYLLLVLALLPVLWPWLWVLFVVLPVVWFVSLNRTLWSTSGSAWAPGV